MDQIERALAESNTNPVDVIISQYIFPCPVCGKQEYYNIVFSKSNYAFLGVLMDYKETNPLSVNYGRLWLNASRHRYCLDCSQYTDLVVELSKLNKPES